MGQTVATPGVLETVPEADRFRALQRHASGDWGEVPPDDAKENELSLRQGFRLLSAYTSESGVTFCIITEANRSSTCMLLPEEY